MIKPSEWIDKRAEAINKLSKVPHKMSTSMICAILDFLDENMQQWDCDTCTNFKPKAPGAVLGTCPFFSGDVVSTFGCKKHARS